MTFGTILILFGLMTFGTNFLFEIDKNLLIPIASFGTMFVGWLVIATVGSDVPTQEEAKQK